METGVKENADTRKRLLIVGAVRGLVSEGERVEELIQKEMLDVVGLAISKEGLTALREHLEHNETNDAPLDNLEEEVYVAGLEAFGEVRKPPPCFSRAVKIAKKNNIRIEPLDMDDEQYTNAFCRNISTLEMMSQGHCGRRMARHTFTAATPEEFVMEFDSIANRSKGFRGLEKEREEHMAMKISELAGKYDDVLAIVELERLAGVSNALKEIGCAHHLGPRAVNTP